jgi:hypothetical protein
VGFPFRGPAPATEDQTGILGLLIDWKQRLLDGLTAPTGGGIATEAQVGQTQLATLAEARAGTIGTKALSPLEHNSVHVVNTVGGLQNIAGQLPAGSIVGLANVSFGTNDILYRSLWYIYNGIATPAEPLQASTKAAIDGLLALVGVGKTYEKIALEPFVSEAIIYRSFGTNNLRDLYRYVGTTTGWLLWKGALALSNRASGITVRDGNAAYINEVRVDGEEVHIDFAVTASGGLSNGQILFAVPTGAGAPIDQFLTCSYIDSSGTWKVGSVYLSADGGVRTLSFSGAGYTSVQGQGRYRRLVPTV